VCVFLPRVFIVLMLSCLFGQNSLRHRAAENN